MCTEHSLTRPWTPSKPPLDVAGTPCLTKVFTKVLPSKHVFSARYGSNNPVHREDRKEQARVPKTAFFPASKQREGTGASVREGYWEDLSRRRHPKSMPFIPLRVLCSLHGMLETTRNLPALTIMMVKGDFREQLMSWLGKVWCGCCCVYSSMRSVNDASRGGGASNRTPVDSR